MKRLLAILLLLAGLGAAKAQDTGTILGLKPGTNRGLVLANCMNCHSPFLISAQHKTREQWEATLTTMKKHGLWELPAALKDRVLEYLVETQGPLPDEGRAPTPWAEPLYRANPIW